MADFGTDINFLTGLDPRLGLVSGTANLGQALAHRLTTPRGSLFYDPDYGTDIRAYLNDTITADKLAQVRADVQAELIKDERVLACIAEVSFDFTSRQLAVSVAVQTANGPFNLVLAVTSVTVELLRFNPTSL